MGHQSSLRLLKIKGYCSENNFGVLFSKKITSQGESEQKEASNKGQIERNTVMDKTRRGCHCRGPGLVIKFIWRICTAGAIITAGC